MKQAKAVAALGALAQETRLAIFRRLVAEGAIGLSAGELARAVAVPPSNLSFHLNQLAAAGLVRARRKGRQVFYAIEVAAVRALLGFLVQDCCRGQPELCLPEAAAEPCCPAPRRQRART